MNTVVRCLRAALFPQYVFEAVPVEQVQAALRDSFARWGQPEALRVDNGPPWGNRHHMPQALTLWLVGLGLDVIHNRPYRPTDNSRVERSHGVLKRWVEPAQCPNFEAFTQRLNRATTLQREQYPSCSGSPRRQAYPALAHPARPYTRAAESEQWQFHRVCQYLAQHHWWRKVSQTGQISRYNRNYSVGRTYRGQMVSIHFEAQTQTWVIEDVQGQRIAQHRFQAFTPHAVQTLQLTHPKKRTP